VVLKFGLDWIISFWEIAIFLCFGDLAWIAYYSPFGLEAYFSRMMWPIVLTPKRTILARKHVVWVIKRENRSSGSTWAHDRENRPKGKDRTRQDSQKSHKEPESWAIGVPRCRNRDNGAVFTMLVTFQAPCGNCLTYFLTTSMQVVRHTRSSRSFHVVSRSFNISKLWGCNLQDTGRC